MDSKKTLAVMSFLRHQNIHILEKALAWQKNGLLRSVASLFGLHFNRNKRPAFALIPIRKT